MSVKQCLSPAHRQSSNLMDTSVNIQRCPVLMSFADLCGLLRHMSTPGAFVPGTTAKVHCFISVHVAQQPSRQVFHHTAKRTAKCLDAACFGSRVLCKLALGQQELLRRQDMPSTGPYRAL